MREPCHIGGEGQLEAVAYYSQMAAAHLHLGVSGAEAVSREMNRAGFSESKYAWATTFAAGRWPTSILRAGEVVFENVATVMMPLLFASLLIRSWGQAKTTPKSENALLPGNRLV